MWRCTKFLVHKPLSNFPIAYPRPLLFRGKKQKHSRSAIRKRSGIKNRLPLPETCSYIAVLKTSFKKTEFLQSSLSGLYFSPG